MSAEAKATKRKPSHAPLKLFLTTFCKHCEDHNYCNTNTERRHLCIESLKTDEIAKIRQLLQQRTQHSTW